MNKFSTLAFAIAICAGSAFAQSPSAAKTPTLAPTLAASAATAPATKPATGTLPTATAPLAATRPTVSAACEAKAIDKNGKALNGAAKTASLKKCIMETSTSTSAKAELKTDTKVVALTAAQAACEAKAVSKDDQALFGAAKAASLKKCAASIPAKK